MVRDHEIHFPWFDRVPACRRDLDVSSADELHRRTLEVLKALDTYDLAPRATWAHPLERRLPLAARVPTLAVAGPRDSAASLVKDVARLAGGTAAALPDEPAGAAEVIAGFLDGSAADAAKAAKRVARKPQPRRYWALP